MEASSSSSSRSRSTSSSSSPPPHPPQPTISYRIGESMANAASPEARDDAISCLVVLLTFWILVSMATILGFYGPVDIVVGPNYSRLLRASSIFVRDIKVKAEEGSTDGPMLYGFRELPPLDVRASWLETHNGSVPANFHKEWIYYFNKGTQIEIFYSVKSEGSYPLNLVIAQGKENRQFHRKENLFQWVENPLRPDTTLSWNLIHGDGVIHQKIEKPSDYYVAVSNLHNLEIEAQLTFRIQALFYNTTGAYFKCSLGHRLCALKLFFLEENVAILASGPRKLQEGKSDEWYIKLSYGPRWITYFVGSGLMTLAILLIYKIFTSFQFMFGYNTSHQTTSTPNETSPLLANKEDDGTSLGSSYESVSHDEGEDIEEFLKAAPSKPLEEVESSDQSQHLCVICCEARKDCFFLPCGHSTTCYTCGLRILEEAQTCPICRRKMKKVRRIFTV
uniref:RING-type domain-containing protein n=1 Tax=Ananas comosus var. bracteatus TaxID=296719 RepID=A0A6V7P094_ANACO|nr:unnamed protein product [Ananas comosus var. bracteatus]